MTLSVVIPTFNRPSELRNCLQSILRQTVMPDEILIMDDGDLPEFPNEQHFADRGVRCLLHRKREKGLTRSRNRGVDLSTGDIVQFFDDDVVLEEAFLEAVLDGYNTLPDPNLGGMGGLEMNLVEDTLRARMTYIYNRLFLLSPARLGDLTRTGFAEQLPVYQTRPPRKIAPARLLGGSSFSFRREVFDRFRFPETYAHGYCQGEDKDFTLRVSGAYTLYVNPFARLRHYPSPSGRVDKFRRGRDLVLSAHFLLRREAPSARMRHALFYYSVAGVLLKALVGTVRRRKTGEWQRVRGVCAAVALIVRNQADSVFHTEELKEKP